MDRRRLAHLAQGPTTVGVLLQRMRRMLGHLGKRDRQIVLDAIEAIYELAAGGRANQDKIRTIHAFTARLYAGEFRENEETLHAALAAVHDQAARLYAATTEPAGSEAR